MGTDDSVLARFVPVEGCGASVLLRKNWQLMVRFLDWVMELLILTDLNSANRNGYFFQGDLIHYDCEIIDTLLKLYL